MTRAVLLLCLAGGSVILAQAPCDATLKAQADPGPFGYQMRGTRCEGSFGRLVSSGALAIVSFTDSFADYDPSSGTSLMLEWEAPSAAPVRVRAWPLRQKLYYQMDAAAGTGTKFTWPVDVLRALGIHRRDIGVTAWISSAARDIHLPVRIRQGSAAPVQDKYQVSLYPAAELSEVYVTLSAVPANGAGKQVVRQSRALDYGYYPADRRIDFPLDKPEAAGIYVLEVGASLTAGGSANASFYFFHPGPRK